MIAKDGEGPAFQTPSETLNLELGARFKTIRTYFGKKQSEMDSFLGIGKKSWQKYESGGQAPGGKILNALTQQGIIVSWLLEGGFGGPMLLEDVDRLSRGPGHADDSTTYRGIDQDTFEAGLVRAREAAAQLQQIEQTVRDVGARFGYEMPDSAVTSLAHIIFTGDITPDGLVRLVVLMKNLSNSDPAPER